MCEEYRKIYKMQVPGKYLAERVSMYVQAHTLYSSVRPFGASAILGIVDKTGPQIYMIEPSGVFWVIIMSSLAKVGFLFCY